MKACCGSPAAGAMVVVAGLLLSRSLGTEFLPQLDEGTIWIRANFPPGISLTKSAQKATAIRHVLEQFPEVGIVASQSGRNDAGTDPFGPNRNEFFVALKPYEEWPAGIRKSQLVDQISQCLQSEIPGAHFSLT
ncbi:MAG TPA: efflux RND transporter permease subunit, partial [Bryobacteraceae bacterium]